MQQLPIEITFFFICGYFTLVCPGLNEHALHEGIGISGMPTCLRVLPSGKTLNQKKNCRIRISMSATDRRLAIKIEAGWFVSKEGRQRLDEGRAGSLAIRKKEMMTADVTQENPASCQKGPHSMERFPSSERARSIAAL